MPLFQTESKCENDFDLHENEITCRTHFHMKGFAARFHQTEKPNPQATQAMYFLSRGFRWSLVYPALSFCWFVVLLTVALVWLISISN